MAVTYLSLTYQALFYIHHLSHLIPTDIKIWQKKKKKSLVTCLKVHRLDSFKRISFLVLNIHLYFFPKLTCPMTTPASCFVSFPPFFFSSGSFYSWKSLSLTLNLTIVHVSLRYNKEIVETLVSGVKLSFIKIYAHLIKIASAKPEITCYV